MKFKLPFEGREERLLVALIAACLMIALLHTTLVFLLHQIEHGVDLPNNPAWRSMTGSFSNTFVFLEGALTVYIWRIFR